MPFDRRVLLSECLLTAAGMLWLSSVAIGFAALSRYALEPGPAGSIPRAWPASAPIERDAHEAILLVFAHPRCPCTRATLHELERIAARCPASTRILVSFLDPGLGDEWVERDLWRTARAIDRVEVVRDAGGKTAAAFGVATSGQALLYDSDGALVFEGGITPSRGHAGDNDGSDAILRFLVSGDATLASTPVRGCRFDACEGGAPRGVVE